MVMQNKFNFILPVLLISACIPSAQYVPVTIPVSDNAFGATVAVLLDEGESIANKDPDAGRVVTEWTVTHVLKVTQRFRWNVAIDQHFHQLTINSQCQNLEKALITEEESWNDCSVQPEERMTHAHALATKINARHI